MRMTFYMYTGFYDARLVLLVLAVLLWPVCVSATTIGNVNLSGSNVGYTYRSLIGSGDDKSTSHQYRGTIRGSTYLSEPWIATADGSFTWTQDTTDIEINNTSSETTITTGDLNLNVLPQSRTPFQISYQMSDSRVDALNAASPLTTLGKREFTTDRLSLKQSYLTEKGDRYQARYYTTSWEDNIGETYDDQMLSGEANIRLPKQTITAKGSFQTTEHSQASKESDNFIVNADHFWYPTRALRVDSMASLYDYDSSSIDALTNSVVDTTTDITQISSFVFWRPEQRPITVSGGMRVFNMASESSQSKTTDQFSVSGTGGAIYQFSKNLRFDGNLDLSTQDNGDEQANYTKLRGGALYQSDIREIFSGYTYQWYSSGSGEMQNTGDESRQGINARIAHDAQKRWKLSEISSLRLSLSQGAGMSQHTGDTDVAVTRIDHSGSVGWNQSSGGTTSFVNLTISDARNMGDIETDQQFFNLQALRNQTINRRSSLTGNFTLQIVKQTFDDSRDSDTVTTTTGQISYNHSRVFDVPQLNFLSDFMISKASSDEGADRAEWENRFDWSIGLLDASLSCRIIDTEREDFTLFYAQVTRRF